MRLRRRGTDETREIRAGMVLGRLDACDWKVDDASVSRRHARVVAEGAALYLEDLGSSNGVLLNGIKVTRLRLRGGDLVTLGAVAFDVLSDDGDAAAPAAAPAAPAPAGEAGPSAREPAAAAETERERARLHADLRRRDRSRGFGDLSQQSTGMKLLALMLGLAVLAGVAWAVRKLGGIL